MKWQEKQEQHYSLLQFSGSNFRKTVAMKENGALFWTNYFYSFNNDIVLECPGAGQ